MFRKNIFVKIIFVFIFVLVSCSPKLKNKTISQSLKNIFMLSDKDSIEIVGIAKEQKNAKLVKFKVNGMQASSKFRHYNSGWQLDEIQSEQGEWKPISAAANQFATISSLETYLNGLLEVIENACRGFSELISKVQTDEKTFSNSEREAYNAALKAGDNLTKAKNIPNYLNDPILFDNYGKAVREFVDSYYVFMTVASERYFSRRDLNREEQKYSEQIYNAENNYNTAVGKFSATLVKEMYWLFGSRFKEKYPIRIFGRSDTNNP